MFLHLDKYLSHTAGFLLRLQAYTLLRLHDCRDKQVPPHLLWTGKRISCFPTQSGRNLRKTSTPFSDQHSAVVRFLCFSFNLYKIFKVYQFLLNFLFAGYIIKNCLKITIPGNFNILFFKSSINKLCKHFFV